MHNKPYLPPNNNMVVFCVIKLGFHNCKISNNPSRLAHFYLNKHNPKILINPPNITTFSMLASKEIINMYVTKHK